jgi:hypothetical protein
MVLHCTKTEIAFLRYREHKKHNFLLTLVHIRTIYVYCLQCLIELSLMKTISRIQHRGHCSTMSSLTKTIGCIQHRGSVCYRLRGKNKNKGYLYVLVIGVIVIGTPHVIVMWSQGRWRAHIGIFLLSVNSGRYETGFTINGPLQE